MGITIILMILLIMADQTTKYLAEKFITVSKEITLIPNVLDATLVYNKGAAWSSFSNATWFLALISLVASIVLMYFLTRNDWKKKKCYSWATTLMFAGTFGNLIDRALAVFKVREGVVDMIIFKPLDALWNMVTKNSFPIFNVADAFLVIGVILLAIDILVFQDKRSVK